MDGTVKMGKIVKFKATIDRIDKLDTNGNLITKEALKGAASQLAMRLDGKVDILLLLRFDPTIIIGGVEKVQFDEEKGELRVGGWVNSDFVSPAMRCAAQYEMLEWVEKNTSPASKIFTKARLIVCGLTEFHSDPNIPPIEVEREWGWNDN